MGILIYKFKKNVSANCSCLFIWALLHLVDTVPESTLGFNVSIHVLRCLTDQDDLNQDLTEQCPWQQSGEKKVVTVWVSEITVSNEITVSKRKWRFWLIPQTQWLGLIEWLCGSVQFSKWSIIPCPSFSSLFTAVAHTRTLIVICLRESGIE